MEHATEGTRAHVQESQQKKETKSVVIRETYEWPGASEAAQHVGT